MNYRMIFYVLGSVMKVEGLLMLLPLCTGLFYGEPVLKTFGLTMAILLALGFLLTWKRPARQSFYAKEGFLVVALGWVVLSFFGALPFWWSGEFGRFADCFFEAVSGFTTTGATVLTDVEAISRGLLMWRSFTHWVGGMGVLVFLLAILPMAGQYSIYLMRAESPGPSVGKLVPRLRETASILYRIYMVMTAVLIILLMLLGLSPFDSLIHAFGTAGTGGFSNYAASVAHFGSPAVEWLIGVAMLLFGVNFSLF